MPNEERTPSGSGDEALAWADTYADVDDFQVALAWLERAERIMGSPLPAGYASKRAMWALAAAGGIRR